MISPSLYYLKITSFFFALHVTWNAFEIVSFEFHDCRKTRTNRPLDTPKRMMERIEKRERRRERERKIEGDI